MDTGLLDFGRETWAEMPTGIRKAACELFYISRILCCFGRLVSVSMPLEEEEYILTGVTSPVVARLPHFVWARLVVLYKSGNVREDMGNPGSLKAYHL